MQLRLVLRTVLFGVVAYLLIMPAIILLTTILINVAALPPKTLTASIPILYLALRLGLFLDVGLIIGRKVTKARIANAALTGILLALGIGLWDTSILMILPKHGHRVPPVQLPYANLFTHWYLGLWREIEIAFAVFGGWLAGRYPKTRL